MTPSQIRSCAIFICQVVPIADTAAKLFYDRLFEIAPEVRPLFKRDMKDRAAN